jgi:hypothetical protein
MVPCEDCAQAELASSVNDIRRAARQRSRIALVPFSACIKVLLLLGFQPSEPPKHWVQVVPIEGCQRRLWYSGALAADYSSRRAPFPRVCPWVPSTNRPQEGEIV